MTRLRQFTKAMYDSKYSTILLLVIFATYGNSNETNQLILSCCNHVSQWNQCHIACMQFASPCPPNAENKTLYLLDFCPQIPSSLDACFNNITSNTETQPTPSPQLLNCCKKSSIDICRTTCTQEVNLGVLDDSSIETVIGACGPPLSLNSDPIWNCFLLYAEQAQQSNNAATESPSGNNSTCPTVSPTSPITTTPSSSNSHVIHFADWPRLQCCSKANDSVCLDACLYEYTGGRTSFSWETLNLDCTFRATEGELVSCLNDVTTRCAHGCTGLNFCSTFNDRPLTSFRRCTGAADAIAKKEYNSWLSTNIIRHPLVTVYTKPLDTCYPEWWKAIACSFQLMPCQSSRDTSLICKEDCLFIMNTCKSSLTQNVEEICEILTPSYLQAGCISLENYLNGSSYTKESVDTELTTPCSSSPCTKGKCIINQACSGSSNRGNCQSYYCVDDSKIGGNPKMGQSCYGYVNCTVDGNGNCIFGGKASNVSHHYCIKESPCLYKGNNYTHNEVFTDECNVCHCQSSFVICTRHNCRYGSQVSDNFLSCSPPYCNCPTYYDPLCTSQGLVLPNILFANCYGYAIGLSCLHGNDPCEQSPCSLQGSKCIPYPHVCLSANESSLTSCPQYHCVNDANCHEYQTKVICDRNNKEHVSMCGFIGNEEEVDYYGHCQVECSPTNRRQVCGVDSKTYTSSCHAKGVGVAVDYIGECSDVPTVSGECSRIKCPGLPYITSSEQCQGPTPPGACCQQCGSMISILINNRQLSHNTKVMGVVSIESTEILARLRGHIDILQCELYGHQSIDGSLIVLMLPSNMTSSLNVDGCNSEAARIATLINRGSPLLLSDPYLSFLVAANHTQSSKILQPTIRQEPGNDAFSVSGCDRLIPSYFLYALLSTALLMVWWTELR